METNIKSLEKGGKLPQPPMLGMEEWQRDLDKGNFTGARELIEKGGVKDLKGAETRLDDAIVNKYGIPKPPENKPFTPNQVENERRPQLEKQVADYGMKHNLDYQTNQILDELLAALDEAVDQAEIYRLKSSREKTWGFPLVTSIQKLFHTKKFKGLLARVEDLYNKVPPELKNKRYMDLLNKDKVSARYGQGDKTSLVGETIGLAGVGTVTAGAAISMNALMASAAVIPGAGLGLLIGGGLASIIGGIVSYFGESKSIESDKQIDQATTKLHDFRTEVLGLKQGVPPNTFQRTYVQNSLTNLELMTGASTGRGFGTAAAGGVAGGVAASSLMND